MARVNLSQNSCYFSANPEALCSQANLVRLYKVNANVLVVVAADATVSEFFSQFADAAGAELTFVR